MAQKKKGYGLMLVNDRFMHVTDRPGALKKAQELLAELTSRGITFTQRLNQTSQNMLRAVEQCKLYNFIIWCNAIY